MSPSRREFLETGAALAAALNLPDLYAGKLADFTMLGADPHDVDPGRLKDIKIVRTVVGGRTMYDAD